MALSALIKKRQDRDLATATPAIPATRHTESEERVAKIATIAVANHQERQNATHAELISLVRFIADFHGFTEEDHDEALSIALADFDNALVCFRALKQDALSTASSTRFKSTGNTHPSTKAKELNLSLSDAREETV
jgi:hypothetical protein